MQTESGIDYRVECGGAQLDAALRGMSALRRRVGWRAGGSGQRGLASKEQQGSDLAEPVNLQLEDGSRKHRVLDGSEEAGAPGTLPGVQVV